MPRSTRRDVLGGVAASALIGTTRAYGFDPAKGPVVNAPSQVPGTPTSLELQVLQTLADGVLKDFALPALSVCVAFEGKILYEHAIGSAVLANPALGTPQMAATPSTLFRVASVSKPITSVTVMNMVQLGLLRLDDRVFGPSGLLQMRFGGVTPVDPRYADITLAHLLTHTSGLPQNDGNDPMFAYPALDAEQLIKKVIETRTLSCAPGTTYRYSNFGSRSRLRRASVARSSSVGAGPAGLEAALTASERGHEVEVHEASNAVGGFVRASRSVWVRKPERSAVPGQDLISAHPQALG